MGEGTSKAERSAPNVKLKAFLAFLNRERVGHELIFTIEHAHQAANELKVKEQYCWSMLRMLEKRGLITRKRGKPGRGISIKFNTSDGELPATGRRKRQAATAQSKNGALTVDQLTARLRSEIEKLEQKLAEKQALLGQIESLAQREA